MGNLHEHRLYSKVKGLSEFRKCVAGIEPYYYDMVMDSGPVAFMTSDRMVGKASGISASSTSEPKIRVRKLFPETWLWFNKTIGYVEVDS